MELEPIERQDTIAEMAYERLKSALMAGAFRPGEALSIRRLASVLGISVTPARDAISRVLWERGLENGPHRTVLVPKLTSERLREIYKVRTNLEGLAASLAAQNFGPQDMAALKAAQAEHIAAVNAGDYKQALAANEKLHFAIYDRCDNATLLELIQGLWLKLGPSLNFLYPTYVQNRVGINHHSEMVDAMSARDPEAARMAVQSDLKDGLEALEFALKQVVYPSEPSLR